MAHYVTNPGTGKVHKIASKSAAVKQARTWANTYGISVPIYTADNEFQPPMKSGKATYRAKRNPTTRQPRGGARYIVMVDPGNGLEYPASDRLSKLAAERFALTWRREHPKDYMRIARAPAAYKANPAMYGGSVLSRSKASTAAGYTDTVKKANSFIRMMRGKGKTRLAKRPARSREHPSTAHNFNSVLKTVYFTQPANGKPEHVQGLTVKEANGLADKLRNYGLKNVRVG